MPNGRAALRTPRVLGIRIHKESRPASGWLPVPPEVALPKVAQLFEAGRLSNPQSIGLRPPVAVSFASIVDRDEGAAPALHAVW